MKITVGCDPEFFIEKISAPGIIVPICGLLGGTKKKPQAISGVTKGFAYQEDGAAAEFNIPPCDSPKQFGGNVEWMVEHLKMMLYKIGYQPVKTNHFNLTQEMIQTHPKLAEIGCDPDIMAYGKNTGKIYEGVPRQLEGAHVGAVRGAGGHVHLGYDKNICPPDVMVKLIDVCIALPLSKKDKQGTRRQYWGLPGLYRDKPYGLEYRTFSNFWIWDREVSYKICRAFITLAKSVEENIIAWQAFFNMYMTSGIWTHIRDSILRETSLDGYARIYYGRVISDPWTANLMKHKVYADFHASMEWYKEAKAA